MLSLPLFLSAISNLNDDDVLVVKVRDKQEYNKVLSSGSFNVGTLKVHTNLIIMML